ncbi:metallophosphoesterase [Mesorhizobium sp. WSM2239]|uniref:Metallophosphoesterase n=2 Tax=unclassified Mesorhizobium TaxID=325217 RepID=A0AAU8D0V4_9HYPH
MDRITEIEIGTARVGILGDPHLGRAFVRGVSLEKRGLREKMVMDDFQARLAGSGVYDVFVCMGDLFDKWAVPFGIIWKAAFTYLTTARDNPDTTYVVIAGNHDISRDLEKKGALDLFELIVSSQENIYVVRHNDPVLRKDIDGNMVGFFPFHPSKPADELVTFDLDIAFGHWDTIFGHDNMVPTEKLAMMGCKTAYTGHVHLPDSFKRDGVEVIQVGSMQPYAHGEDNGEMYFTLHLNELMGKDLRFRCVRVLLAPGEILDQDVDCLQLTVKREGTSDEETEEVSMGDFDLMALFAQAFNEAGVPDEVRQKITDRFEEARVAE